MDNTDSLINLRNTLTAQLEQVKQRMQEKHTKLNAAIDLGRKQRDFIKALYEDTVVYTPGPSVNLIDLKENLDKKQQELQLEYQTKVDKHNARMAEFEIHDSMRRSVQKVRMADLRNELHCFNETWANEKKRTTAIYEQELNKLVHKIRQLKAESMQLKCEEQHVLLSGCERLTDRHEGVRDIRQQLLEVDAELKNAKRIALHVPPEEVSDTEVENMNVELRNEVNGTYLDMSQVPSPSYELPQTPCDSVRCVPSEPAPFLPLREKRLDDDWNVDDYQKHQQSLLFRIKDPQPLIMAAHISKHDEGLASVENIRPEQIVVQEPQKRVIAKPRKRKLLNESMLEDLVPDPSQK